MSQTKKYTADKFIVDGGTSSGFLKADGSIDTTAYGTGSSSFDGAYSSLSGIPSTFTPSAHTLDSHSNVTITSNSSGEVLKWNGTAWVNNTLSEAGIAASGDIPTVTSDLTNDSGFISSTTGDWTGTFDGQEGSYYLNYNNLSNVPSTFAPSAHTLDSHSNVTITSNSSGEILKWNGTAWINNTLSEAGIAASSAIPTATSDLTNDSGFITDGNTNWNNTYGFITPTSTDTLTNKSGNISQWTNDSNYSTFDGAYSSLTGIPSTFAPSGHTLDSHSNVTITSNSSGEVLKWNGTAWVNNTLAEAGIAASGDIPTATSDLTNDSGFLSSVTGDWTGTFDGQEGSYYLDYNNFTNTPTASTLDGTGAANKLAFWTDADSLSNDTNLHWDGTNDRLGIGETTPTATLDVGGTANIQGTIKLDAGTGVADALRFGTHSLTVEGGNDGSHDIFIGTTSASYKSLRLEGATTFFQDGTGTSNAEIAHSSGDATFSGDVEAANLIKTGGTSSQYLMADGSTSTLTNPVTGTGTSGYVTLWNGSNSIGSDTSLFFDSTNNRLGIGDVTPDYNLDVAGTIGMSSYIYHNDDSNSYFGFPSNDTFRIATAGSNRFTIDSAGHVGIGASATTPASAFSTGNILELMSSGVPEIILDHTDGGTTTDIGLLSFRRNGDQLGHFKAIHDGSTTAMRLGLHMQASGGSFASSASNEKFRWTSAGDFHADGDVIAYSTTISDARLKDDVETIENPNLLVKELRGVSYKWNSGSREGQKEIGLIAQEVEKVIPEIVREKELISGDVVKTVDYEKLVGLLIESNKQLINKIEKLEKAVYNK